MTEIHCIVAAAKNGVIGRENALPWSLKADLQHFKAVTMGKPVVMGRLTFESIGQPLPGRQNIVITRNAGYVAAGCTVVASLDAAIAAAGDVPAIMVIGGAQIYAQALPLATRVYLTEVLADVAGDAVLPELDQTVWREVTSVPHAADADNDYACRFVTLERR